MSFALLALVAALAMLAAPSRAGDQTEGKQKLDEHILLIRGLQSEIAVSKLALPRGKRGIYLNSQGQIDDAKLQQELKEQGAAIRPGMPIEITRLFFKPDRLVFEINHGGKSGKKWYQHIEIGVGGATQPIAPSEAPVLAYGSFISLVFPDKMPPQISVDEVKKLLGPVLDFNRQSPTVLYSPNVPPKVKKAIEKHEIIVGMDRDAVLSSKGPPDRKVRETTPEGEEKEQWLYGNPPHVLFVTFDGDNVVAVKQY